MCFNRQHKHSLGATHDAVVPEKQNEHSFQKRKISFVSINLENV